MDLPGVIPLNVERELRRVDRELNLFHSKRQKRGLINILGTGIKFITGNMDNEDAEAMKKQLAVFEANQNQFLRNVNLHSQFSKSINDELKNITDHINLENQLYSNNTKNVSHAIEDLQMELRTKIATDGIVNALRILHDHITDIRQSISFAKTGILSAHLLETAELANLTIWQYENIKTGLMHNSDKDLLFFIIQIPIMTEQKCKKLLIIPMPNHENNTEVLVDEKDDYIVCNNIVYIRNGPEMKNIKKPKDNCIKNYFNGKPLQCTFIENKEPSINQITDNIIVIKNVGKTFIANGCNKIASYNIVGHYIIKIHNCTIKINNTLYISLMSRNEAHFNIPFTYGHVEAKFKPKITLESLHHRDLKQIEDITLLQVTTKKSSYMIYYLIGGAAVIILYIIQPSYLMLFRICCCRGSQRKVGGVTSQAQTIQYMEPIQVSPPGTVSTLYRTNPFLRAGIHYHVNANDTTSLHIREDDRPTQASA